MRFAFIGHRFHNLSRSTQFFRQILGEIGEVDSFDADPDGSVADDDAVVLNVLKTTYDCYVFLQTEFIAERLRPLISGRIVIVPMYDGAHGRTDTYWRQFLRCQFISFSQTHHEYLSQLDCNSAVFQYFPAPGPAPSRNPGNRSAFFWERRPDHKVNLELVLGLCRQLGIEKLHVHAAPDFDRLKDADRHGVDEMGGVAVSWSTWFERREDYERAASDPQYYFAPRLREGIGMASLEAMCRGQIVVAPDLPTANEYIRHATTGILYDPDRPEIDRALDGVDLQEIGRNARRRAEIGRMHWLADVDRLKSLLLADGRRWSTSDASAGFVNAIRAAASRRVFERAGRRARGVAAS